MQALERTIIDTNWITILLVFLLGCVFLLKGLSITRLKGSATSLLNNSFIETEIEENYSVFNLFQSVIFLFSMLVISLSMYKIILFYVDSVEQGFYTFLKILSLVFSYFAVKWLLEVLFSLLFKIKNQVKFFLASKSFYLYSVSFTLLIGVVLVEYSQLNTLFLVYFSAVLFSVRFIIHTASNKKLIFSELFYFILYLCAFEIAPLFILFKLLF
ncbi:DUF4271 domain-containing protein [Polaribacter sp. Hel1_85]|uniref:DUF4271 domain-containing protein n=1 Tax=Polaribacter sp. Hel1_85 TaxID=1250005 RepID=UPI00052C343D|nr:conserved hypothetical membrane protein [Polaribacter sp. Hel1_85]